MEIQSFLLSDYGKWEYQITCLYEMLTVLSVIVYSIGSTSNFVNIEFWIVLEFVYPLAVFGIWKSAGTNV